MITISPKVSKAIAQERLSPGSIRKIHTVMAEYSEHPQIRNTKVQVQFDRDVDLPRNSNPCRGACVYLRNTGGEKIFLTQFGNSSHTVGVTTFLNKNGSFVEGA
jgi:hypothetical protein